MLAIEASMVARVTAATVGEVGCTAAIEEDSKAEGEEKNMRIHNSNKGSFQNRERRKSLQHR
jgi:hypothetical protein